MLNSMVQRLLHEPSYNSGSLLNETPALAAGWAAHRGSFADGMPAWNNARDVCLLFSGEHFGPINGRPISSVGDLVRTYDELGAKFFRSLNGIFSGVLLDLREKKVILFNDRYGLGRIYYHESTDGFYFSSEAKCLLKVLPQLRRLDMRSLGEWFACGCALQNRTLFEGISLLPGGSQWTFRRGQLIEKANYFRPSEWETPAALAPEDYYKKLREVFSQIVPAYFSGSRKLGLSLTGGLDSRMILATAPPAPGSMPTYTFGGMYRECADVRISRQVARVCGLDHRVLPVDHKFFGEFPGLASRSIYYSDGCMDVTGAVELFANRMAREIAPVRMTGNYGGEILRGYVAFRPNDLGGAMFDEQFLPTFRRAAETYADERRGSQTSFIAFKQVPWHHYSRLSLEQTQLTVRSPYLDNNLVPLAWQAPTDAALNKQFALRLIGEQHPGLGKIPTDRGSVGRLKFLPHKARTFCEEFLPRAEYVYDYGMPQWLAKVDRILDPLHLDRLFLGAQKFAHFRTWYRHDLAPYVQEMLLDSRTLARPFLNSRQVKTMVQEHVTGHGNHTVEIHKLLSVELLQRQLIEQS